MPENSQRSPVRFAFSHRDLDSRTAVVEIEGDCDLATAPMLKWALVDLLGGGRTRLIADLSRVTFMDSTALGALVGVQMNLKHGETLVLAAAPPTVLSLFELTGLDRKFSLFSTVDSAVAHLGSDLAQALGDAGPRVEYQPALPATGDPARERTELTRDAALALGIAATAVPFARSRAAQAERWLRALCRCGGAGVALSSLGVTDVPGTRGSERGPGERPETAPALDRDAVAVVTDRARRLAGRRPDGSPVSTTDLLAAVIEGYGSDLDRVLAGYGTSCTEVSELLACDLDELAES